jgi:hypothetical protein
MQWQRLEPLFEEVVVSAATKLPETTRNVAGPITVAAGTQLYELGAQSFEDF